MNPLPDGGIYQLLLHLPAPRVVVVGALGPCEFAAGWYVYTGSMRRHLAHRLRRHAAAAKPLRWHIDYLTVAVGVAATRCWPLWEQLPPGVDSQECWTHRQLVAAGAAEPVPGFGSSDCRCRAHLAWLGPERAGWDAPAGPLGTGDQRVS